MPKDLTRGEEQRGTRRVLMSGAVAAIAVFVILLLIFGIVPPARP
jgi:hypothetical protein